MEHFHQQMNTLLVISALGYGVLMHHSDTDGAQVTLDERLIVACFSVDEDAVRACIARGANVNGTFGRGNREALRDPWTLAIPAGTHMWTPLLALANASPYPPPPRTLSASAEDRRWAKAAIERIPTQEIQEREARLMRIFKHLVDKGCKVEAQDISGASPLYVAIYRGKEELALALLKHDAPVNVKTKPGIDGVYEITPLHRAFRSPILTRKLLERGADPMAKDSAGFSPKEWAVRNGNESVIRCYDEVRVEKSK